MRLWHKDLIEVLPRQQLLSQWRECCCIAKNIIDKGFPNHILVNRIMDYSLNHFQTYTYNIICEMRSRGFTVQANNFKLIAPWDIVPNEYLFINWHNERYLKQCFCNLQEKYDCGGISDDEFYNLCKKYIELTGDNNV